jgi:hypothetical protein
MGLETGIYGWTNGDGGVHFYRLQEPLRVAAKHGIKTGIGNRLDDEVCDQYDTVLAHMLWDERNSGAWQTLASKGRHRLVFDIDDLMWVPDWKPFRAHYQPDVLDRLRDNIQAAHVVTTPSPTLADQVREFTGHTNVHVCPNTVPGWLTKWRMPERPYPNDRATWQRYRTIESPPLVIGYQGSPSHQHDFPIELLKALNGFLEHSPPAWTLHFWGPDIIPGWPTHRTGNTPWKPSVPSYLRSLSMDIGIGPLADTPFNRCKSSLRAVEYAALGIPAILPDLAPYADPRTPGGVGVVEHGVTGLLVQPGHTATEHRKWIQQMRYLAGAPGLREEMSNAARLRATEWTTEFNIHRWANAWNSA